MPGARIFFRVLRAGSRGNPGIAGGLRKLDGFKDGNYAICRSDLWGINIFYRRKVCSFFFFVLSGSRTTVDFAKSSRLRAT